MDEIGIKSPNELEANELREEYESLRHLVVSALVLCIIVAGALDLFLLRQAKYASADAAKIRPQIQQMEAEYQKVRGPAIDEFLRKLVQYGQTHPDFAPILAKYNIKAAGATGAAPSSAPPALTLPKK
jgi:hypothetical protein